MNIGYIYIISSKSTDKIYVGSTISSLSHRLSQHKCSTHCSSIEILKFEDAIIELIEEINYDDINELHWKEREYQEQFEDISVNKKLSIKTQEEVEKKSKQRNKNWKETNKQYYKDYCKEYNKKQRDINKNK
jgi:hypothetical protein